MSLLIRPENLVILEFFTLPCRSIIAQKISHINKKLVVVKDTNAPHCYEFFIVNRSTSNNSTPAIKKSATI